MSELRVTAERDDEMGLSALPATSITPATIAVVEVLLDHGNRTWQEIADLAHLDSNVAALVLTRLVVRDWVICARNETGRPGGRMYRLVPEAVPMARQLTERD